MVGFYRQNRALIKIRGILSTSCVAAFHGTPLRSEGSVILEVQIRLGFMVVMHPNQTSRDEQCNAPMFYGRLDSVGGLLFDDWTNQDS
jgi:hypothetical protein